MKTCFVEVSANECRLGGGLDTAVGVGQSDESRIGPSAFLRCRPRVQLAVPHS